MISNASDYLQLCREEGNVIFDGPGSQGKTGSSERLMRAIIDLVAEKGYNGVTTKEIAAEAGVNEVTLFRNFGSKQELLEKAFHHFHYAEEMTKLFREKIQWDLHADLLMLGRRYHELMNRNRKLFLIAQKESQVFKQFEEKAHKHPRILKELLTRYFDEMQKLGKMAPARSELQALSFLWMNHGAFMNSLHGGDSLLANVSLDDFIKESVQTFTRALSP